MTQAEAYLLTHALREALAGQGTGVDRIHPGPIATDMGAAAGLADIAEPPSLVGEAPPPFIAVPIGFLPTAILD